MKWSEAKSIILKNKDVQKELKMNEAEYKIIEEIIMARKEKNMTQKDWLFCSVAWGRLAKRRESGILYM